MAYYQQVGRAGRALDEASAVLLPAESDAALWRYFATATVPDPDHAAKVLAVLDEGPATVAALEAATGIRRGRLESLLKIMAVDGATARGRGGLDRPPAAGWTFDAAKYDGWSQARARRGRPHARPTPPARAVSWSTCSRRSTTTIAGRAAGARCAPACSRRPVVTRRSKRWPRPGPTSGART